MLDYLTHIPTACSPKLHLFHSDVYYVRAAMEKHTGYVFPLDKVEEAMRAEGWKEHRHLPKKRQHGN